ncbi:MAG: GAF domain-containing sensor histidine kinase [Chloroflexi bacterium]|nr:GAF domain-containing sensor histidine kinase [Chloroflexota bacterium]
MSTQTRFRSVLKTTQNQIHSISYQVLAALGIAVLLFIIIAYIGFTDKAMIIGLFAMLGLVVTGIGSGLLVRFLFNYRQSGGREAFTRLQKELERANAVYKFSSKIGGTLDYNSTLNEALEVGQLALNKQTATNLIGAAMLFRQEDNLLHVATARLLNRQDLTVSSPAREGILANALESHEPVFGESGKQDPELRHYTAFQNARSLLAIPLRVGYESYGVLVFGSVEADAFDHKAAEPMGVIGTQISIALKNAVLYQTLIEDKERIVSIDEQARKKLSRDLHDGPTQTIALISSVSSVIQRYMKNGDHQKAYEELTKVQNLAGKTVKEIRHLLFSLRPLVLENKGLIAALEELAHKMKETYGQEVTIEADAQVESLLNEEAQGTIFYIIEEAINNASKHAEASNIWARLIVQHPYILVEIEDNGRGFNVEDITTDYHKRGSLGMVNLRERAEMLRGELNISSTVGQGTRISTYIPVQDKDGNSGSQLESHIPASSTRMAQGLRPTNSTDKPASDSGWENIKL